MANPAEIVNLRYGSVFLSKSKNLKLVSDDGSIGNGKEVTIYNAVLDTGAVTPVVLSALIDGKGPGNGATLSELNWTSVHVRSYNSWNDIEAANVELADTDAKKPVTGALKGLKDLKIRAVAESKNSKVYQFEQADFGKLTLFTAKPIIATGGNDLPNKSTFLPWLAESNFVYEK